jgi:hypothetical protein
VTNVAPGRADCPLRREGTASLVLVAAAADEPRLDARRSAIGAGRPRSVDAEPSPRSCERRTRAGFATEPLSLGPPSIVAGLAASGPNGFGDATSRRVVTCAGPPPLSTAPISTTSSHTRTGRCRTIASSCGADGHRTMA